MNFFECCHKCKPPKRYPGCSGKCPEYKESREKHEAFKESEKKRKDLERYNKSFFNY